MYKNIEGIILEIAYDNGAVYRGRTVQDVLDSCQKVLDMESKEFLEALEEWLSTLNEEEFYDLANGEETKSLAVSITGPGGVEDFLNNIFDVL